MKKGHLVFYIFLTAFLLNLVWENAQAPLYEGYTNFWDHFMICFWASLVDAVVVLLLYFLFVAWYKDFFWIRYINLKSAIILIIIGGGIAVGFEQWAFSRGMWSYTNKMPVIFLSTGLTPLLQMMLLPLLSMYIARKLASESDK
ncbi:MAG: hypothetical protein ACNS60_21260 [Candidatus Cyclobacteriaceae bacterium M2_1C_046]